MYSQSYGSPPPELSNNPFIDHPSNALNRYPDINGTDNPSGTTSQFTSWLQPQDTSATQNAGFAPSAQSAPVGGGYQAPQQTGWNGGSYPQQQPQQQYNSGYVSPVQTQPTGRPFQPSSAFGQVLQGQLNTYAPQSQQQQVQQVQQVPQYTGYPASPQYGAQPQYGYPQQQQTGTYIAEFDPYASQAQPPAQQAPATTSASTSNGYRPPHPREFIQQNKVQMEQWDNYAWKQALNSFDGLKDAWLSRKMEIEAKVKAMGGAGLFGGGGYGGGYGGAYGVQAYGQAEINRLEQLAKQAEQNGDAVIAARFQMVEVHGGYRESGDLASKKRVRESINAALTSLPDWPPQQY